ncbi:MAG: hypothetical protein RI973_994 [Bacteroidota bacterium]|jgi:alkaline phosphatase D
MNLRTPLLSLLLLLTLPTQAQELYYPELKSLLDNSRQPFCFGVASGDPLDTAVVIWSRLYLEAPHQPQTVFWEVARDSAMTQTVRAGTRTTDAANGYTVKVDVNGLKPGQTYFYRFRHNDVYSPVGRTRTAAGPGQGDLLRLAVVSCADYRLGFYNAFGDIARRNDLDAVLHLGDYIYEYGSWGRMQKKTVRQHIPDKVCADLIDYRTRYAQYRCDPQLAEAHRLHPFIVIWDDHEIANDSYATGTRGGLSGEAWEARKAAGRQAYFEWMPLRENPEQSIVRSFSFGDLAELWMLDGRLTGRSPQAQSKADPELQNPERTMLGKGQREWLLQGVKSSRARWKLLGNQVVFSPMNDSRVFDRVPGIPMDRWDGYPFERQAIFDTLYQHNIKNVVVLTGDIHTSWAFELTAKPFDPGFYNPDTGSGVIGAEFVSPSISSFNFDEALPRIVAAEARRRLTKKSNNPHLRYLDLIHHGYMTLTLTREQARADWFFLPVREYSVAPGKLDASYYLEFNGNAVRKVGK